MNHITYPLNRTPADHRLGSFLRCPDCGRYTSTILRVCEGCQTPARPVSGTPDAYV